MKRTAPILLSLLLSSCLAAPPVARAKKEPAKPNTTTSPQSEPSDISSPSPKAEADGPETLSPAERIARLQRSLVADEEHLAAVQANLREQEEEFQEAGDEFKQVDQQLEELREARKAAETAGKTEEAEKLREGVAGLEQKRQLARERFDLAIASKKTAQERIAGLQTKIEQDRQALEKLLAPSKPPAADAGAEENGPSAEPTLMSPPAEDQPLARASADSAPSTAEQTASGTAAERGGG